MEVNQKAAVQMKVMRATARVEAATWVEVTWAVEAAVPAKTILTVAAPAVGAIRVAEIWAVEVPGITAGL